MSDETACTWCRQILGPSTTFAESVALALAHRCPEHPAEAALTAAHQRIAKLERERDAAIEVEQHRLIDAVKRYDPLTSTHCGDWEQSDMIAHGVHKSIIEVLRKSVQSKKLAAHRAAQQSGTGEKT